MKDTPGGGGGGVVVEDEVGRGEDMEGGSVVEDTGTPAEEKEVASSHDCR